MKAVAKTEAEVRTVLSKLAEAHERRKLDDFMKLIAPDPDVVMIDTTADERHVGLAEIRALLERDWSQLETLSLKFG